MIIYSKGENMSECKSAWGDYHFELTREEVMALLDGKILGDPDFGEYGTFISMEEIHNDQD